MSYNIQAKVVSGRGLASHARIDDTAKLSKLLNITLVNGSLNLVSHKPVWLNKKAAILPSEKGHIYWHATLNDYPVIINRWHSDCPAHIYEVYADTKLRDKLNLNDSDSVKLSISDNIIDLKKNNDIKYIISWYLAWYGREYLYYKSLRYIKFLGRKVINKYLWRATQEVGKKKL